MTKIVMLGLLGICSWQDIRRRELAVMMLLLFGSGGIILHLIEQQQTLAQMLGGMLVGIVVLVTAFISRQKIGIGDGILLIVTGIYLGFWGNIRLLLTAQILAAICGCYLMLVKKVGKNYELPFVPFVFSAYMGILAGELL